MKFKIDRNKWRCGDDGEHARGKGKVMLSNTQGYMCCLGQTLCQQGVLKKDLLNLGEPNEINSDYIEEINNIFFKSEYIYESDITIHNTELSDDVMFINDNPSTNLREKESALKELFKEHGHSISFYGKSVRYDSK